MLLDTTPTPTEDERAVLRAVMAQARTLPAIRRVSLGMTIALAASLALHDDDLERAILYLLDRVETVAADLLAEKH